MKRLVLILLLSFWGLAVIAQKPDTPRITNSTSILSHGIIDSIPVRKELKPNTFLTLIGSANLADTIQKTGMVTIFAPTDKAFEKDSLAKIRNKMSYPVAYYIVPQKLTSKDLKKLISQGNGQAILITLSGHKLIASINTNRNIVLTDETGKQAIISKFDIPEKDGVLHIITSTLSPSSQNNNPTSK